MSYIDALIALLIKTIQVIGLFGIGLILSHVVAYIASLTSKTLKEFFYGTER